ncbi:MAG: cysteine hydrolase [Caulobacteraceae bacterium]|nr:cysteine hydrolase [Caulobacteraceae bacterium]
MFDPSSTVLIPIDMQRAFDAPPWPRRWNPAVDENGQALLAAWRRAGAPIIHVRHDSVEPGSTLALGAPGNALRPGFEPREGEPLVSKSVNAAFIGTDLDLRLRRMGASRLVLFGISTDMCVSTSSRVASNLGWQVTLVEDACDCFDLPDPRGGTLRAEDVHAAHVATLGAEFCQVMRTAEAVQAIAGRAAA